MGLGAHLMLGRTEDPHVVEFDLSGLVPAQRQVPAEHGPELVYPWSWVRSSASTWLGEGNDPSAGGAQDPVAQAHQLSARGPEGRC